MSGMVIDFLFRVLIVIGLLNLAIALVYIVLYVLEHDDDSSRGGGAAV